MIKNFSLKKYLRYLTVGLSSIVIVAAVQQYNLGVSNVSATAHLAGGDFMQAFNNTTQQGTWTDPISAESGQIVEFRVTAKNDGDQPAEHVQIWGSASGQVPQGPAAQLVITGKIASSSFGGNEVTDTATVNIAGGKSEGLRYLTGHARLNGVTDKFNCPGTCSIGDEVLGGIDVGTIQPGDFVEVTFKASVTNTPAVCVSDGSCSAAAPECGKTTAGVDNCGNACTKQGSACVPACVSNDTCSVSTPTACGQTNTGVDNCGKTCSRSSAACQGGQQQSQSQSVNITNQGNVGVGGAQVTQLPKTGLPALAWTALAFIPAGFGMRRFSKVKKDLENHPSYIAEDRQFKSEL